MVPVKAFRNKLLNRAKNYANESNLHGLRYITATGNRYEKIFWGVLCLACTVMAAVMMKLMADRFYDSPTITTIESINYPITEVEFPAVTICNRNPFTSSSAKEMTEKFTSYGMNESIVKVFLSELRYIHHGYLENSEEEIKNISAVMDKLGYNLETLLFELMQPCEELLLICYWLGELQNCSDIFQNLKTQFGFCCSFNWRGEPFAEISNLSIKSNFKVSTKVKGEPLYVKEAGALDSGLTVWIQQDTVYDFLRDKMDDGHLVWLHGPTQYPDNSLRRSLLKPNYEATFILRPKVMDSSPNVRSLSVQQRKCFFPEENPLDMEENYSYEACKLEYKKQGYLRKCGCIPFFYPNKKKMRTCGFQDMNCLYQNGEELDKADAHLKDKNWNVGSSSHCLQTCNSIRYDWWLRSERIDADKEMGYLMNQTFINVIFEDNVCIKYRTESLMTWESLIASFGGIFGLCLGGSVVSLIEIIYHFTYVFLKDNTEDKRKQEMRNIIFIGNGSNLKWELNGTHKISPNDFHIGKPFYTSSSLPWVE